MKKQISQNLIAGLALVAQFTFAQVQAEELNPTAVELQKPVVVGDTCDRNQISARLKQEQDVLTVQVVSSTEELKKCKVELPILIDQDQNLELIQIEAHKLSAQAIRMRKEALPTLQRKVIIDSLLESAQSLEGSALKPQVIYKLKLSRGGDGSEPR